MTIVLAGDTSLFPDVKVNVHHLSSEQLQS